MSVPRRQFVQALGLGVLGLAGLPPLGPGSRRDRFIARDLGFSIEFAQPWQLVSAIQLDELRAAARLPGGEAAKEMLLAWAGMPIVVASRERVPRRGPTLVVWRQPTETWHHRADEVGAFAEVHTTTYRDYLPHLRAARMLVQGNATEFAGRPASHCVIEFGEDNASGEGWMVRLDSRMIRWHTSWLTFNFIDLLEGWGPQARAEFRQVERAVEFYAPAT